MKRTFLLRVAIFSFFLAGLTFISSTQQLQAQSSLSNDVFSIPTLSFVSSQVAIIRLDGALTTIKNEMALYAEGTPQYKLMYGKWVCFNTTKESIEAGKTVAESIVDGLIIVSTDEYALPKGTVQTFRTELINLLKS